jgi:hypothetical protein
MYQTIWQQIEGRRRPIKVDQRLEFESWSTFGCSLTNQLVRSSLWFQSQSQSQRERERALECGGLRVCSTSLQSSKRSSSSVTRNARATRSQNDVFPSKSGRDSFGNWPRQSRRRAKSRTALPVGRQLLNKNEKVDLWPQSPSFLICNWFESHAPLPARHLEKMSQYGGQSLDLWSPVEPINSRRFAVSQADWPNHRSNTHFSLHPRPKNTFKAVAIQSWIVPKYRECDGKHKKSLCRASPSPSLFSLPGSGWRSRFTPTLLEPTCYSSLLF